jgi:signal transduction histidine kinase
VSAVRNGVPVRGLLGTALVLIVAVPAAVTLSVHLGLQAIDRPGPADLLTARAYIIDGLPNWRDPAWRSGARAYLGTLGVDAAVQPAGQPVIYLTGRHQSASAASDKFVVRDSSGRVFGSAWVTTGSRSSTTGWGEPLAAGAATLLFVLAAFAFLVGRAIVRPLAALSSAARAIADGDFDIRLPASPVREVNDAMTAMEGMRVRLASALHHQSELEQERRMFVGAIAHDLRTPIFTLRAYLDGLRDGLAVEPERAMRYVEVCQRKVAALDRLVSDLFSFAQVDLLDQPPRRDVLDLGSLLRQCASSLESKRAARAATIAVAGSPDPCPIFGDEYLLVRVVDNLLDNALRHTPDGGGIHLQWVGAGDRVTFVVEDSGPGIAIHDLPHVFEPLFRGESSRNRETGGAGLGLSIAQRIVRAHGGELSAANSPEGHARFTAWLPSGRQ